MEHGYRSTLTLADVTTQKMLHRVYKGNQKETLTEINPVQYSGYK